MNLYVLNDSGSSPVATNYFVSTILARLGFSSVVQVEDLRNVPPDSWVFVYQAKDFFKSKLTFKNIKFVTWFQGVVPEEALMTKNSYLRYFLWTFLEYFCLAKTDWALFVSKAMLDHYKTKYSYSRANFSIIPCVNRDAKYSVDKIVPWKERRPHSYIYAGSMHKWQAIYESLAAFKFIKENIFKDATLTIVTEEKEFAHLQVRKMNLNGVEIFTAYAEELDAVLQRHRYGFLLRGKSPVNFVSTPTKMSTYLSNRVLPITTDAVGIFSCLKFGDFKLAMSCENIDKVSDISNHIYKLSGVADVDSCFKSLENQYFEGPNSFNFGLKNLDKFRIFLKSTA